MKLWRRSLIVLLCTGLWACSDDTTSPEDGAVVDAGTSVSDSGTSVGKEASTQQDSTVAPPGQEGGVAVDLGGGGQCTAWTSWACTEQADDGCQATCGSRTLECSTKGGHVECDCDESGASTGCMYNGPSPATCTTCQEAFAGGCCAP